MLFRKMAEAWIGRGGTVSTEQVSPERAERGLERRLRPFAAVLVALSAAGALTIAPSARADSSIHPDVASLHAATRTIAAAPTDAEASARAGRNVTIVDLRLGSRSFGRGLHDGQASSRSRFNLVSPSADLVQVVISGERREACEVVLGGRLDGGLGADALWAGTITGVGVGTAPGIRTGISMVETDRFMTKHEIRHCIDPTFTPARLAAARAAGGAFLRSEINGWEIYADSGWAVDEIRARGAAAVLPLIQAMGDIRALQVAMNSNAAGRDPRTGVVDDIPMIVYSTFSALDEVASRAREIEQASPRRAEEILGEIRARHRMTPDRVAEITESLGDTRHVEGRIALSPRLPRSIADRIEAAAARLDYRVPQMNKLPDMAEATPTYMRSQNRPSALAARPELMRALRPDLELGFRPERVSRHADGGTIVSGRETGGASSHLLIARDGTVTRLNERQEAMDMGRSRPAVMRADGVAFSITPGSGPRSQGIAVADTGHGVGVGTSGPRR